MGVCPSFFRLASPAPEVARGLVDLAAAAYLDSAPPALFKEILFTYLSGFCSVRYCVGRHAGFLLGQGYIAGDASAAALAPSEVGALLSEPMPDSAELAVILDALEGRAGPLAEWPDLRGAEGRRFRIACAMVFLHGRDARAWAIALRRLLGPTRYEQLMFFLAFVRTAHFWTEVHPELRWEPDLEALVREHDALADTLLGGDAKAQGPAVGARLRAEADELREARELVDALRESQERWKLALEASELGAWELNLRDHTAWRSPRHDEIFGYDEPLASWTYDRFLEHVLPEDRARVHASLEWALAERTDWRFECRIRRADGAVRRVRATGRARYGAESKPVLMWGVVEDVTEQRRSEQALREAGQRKDEFLAVLGHELRNPLAPLSTGVEMLERSRANPEVIDTVHAMMQRQLAHLVRLVDDLLDVSRINRGVMELQRVPLDLHAVVDAAREQAASLIANRTHDLVVRTTDEPLTVYGDFDRLTQVVGNMLRNAARYMDPGGTIRLTTEVVEGRAIVHVEDEGYGIPPEQLDKLFQMFSQIPEHRRATGGGGLGIGLALSRQLVELHGGTLEARSGGLGRGSRFTLQLPLCPHREGAVRERGAHASAAVRARRVLVVDDNADAAESLRMALEHGGHDVRAVPDGPRALEATQIFSPDVVLLDIGLPGMDGYEVARRLRASARGPRLVVVAVTGWGQETDKRRAREAGCDYHLTKPVDREALRSLLAGLPG